MTTKSLAGTTLGEKGKPPPVARALAPPLQTSFRPIRCRPPSSPSSRFPFAGMNQFALLSRRSEFGESRCTSHENFGENNLGGIGAKLPRWPGNLFYPLGRPSVPSASGFRRFFCPDFRFLGCIGYPCPPCVEVSDTAAKTLAGATLGIRGEVSPAARALVPPLQTSIRPIRLGHPPPLLSEFPFAGMNQFALPSLRAEFGDSRYNNENFGGNNFGEKKQSSPSGPGTCSVPPDA